MIRYDPLKMEEFYPPFTRKLTLIEEWQKEHGKNVDVDGYWIRGGIIMVKIWSTFGVPDIIGSSNFIRADEQEIIKRAKQKGD